MLRGVRLAALDAWFEVAALAAEAPALARFHGPWALLRSPVWRQVRLELKDLAPLPLAAAGDAGSDPDGDGPGAASP